MTSSSVNRAAGRACVGVLLCLTLISSPLQAAEWQSGAHIKYLVSHSRYGADNLFAAVGFPSTTDQQLDLRLTAKGRWREHWDAELHYDAAAFYSDSIEAGRGLPALAYGGPSDRTRLFRLTGVGEDEGPRLQLHRFDRASLGYSGPRFVFRFGRHAVSWGNGLVFQPMDIFNPFAPTAIDKEYKPGDDMIYLQELLESGNDLQAVVIPRRDAVTGQLRNAESSLAVKYHHIRGGMDLDLLAARHYDADLAGLGLAVDWQGAVVRADLINTWSAADSYFSGVTSINSSWVWGGYNVTGYLEYFYNGYGIGDGDYSPAALAAKPELVSRIDRGELYSLGRNYLALGATLEVTPLWRFNPLLINNLDDNSWLSQWSVVFDWRQDLVLQLGITLPAGDKGTEYGGIPAAAPATYVGGGRSAFLQLAYYL